MNSINWYSFEPVDTLIFRSSKSMIMGEVHEFKFNFPPPIQTIIGAIRTYFYKIDKVKYKDLIREGHENAGFEVIGPFFEENGIIFIPAPYLWYLNKKNDDKEYSIIKSEVLKSNIIKSSSKDILWVRKMQSFNSLGGKWISYDSLDKVHLQHENIKNTEDFFITELRTGIALTNKVVRQHHIYSLSHCKLKDTVKIVFGVNIDELGDSGVLSLGAEQRFGKFKKIKFNIDLNRTGDKYMSLSLIEGNDETNNSVLATGKIQYLGGWDLYKGFHKNMKGYFPAGTVFNKKFSNCIAIT